jgi:D-beta-D-heptose 7-phosphate kinase/D-beta-D-heptose 1-phosphate adenosyltransferase
VTAPPPFAASLAQLGAERAGWRERGLRVAFTNGCFDLLHAGHLSLLEQARAAADVLVVAINSDASVRRLKGAGRPTVPEMERAEVLRALESVDRVTIYEEDTPLRAIEALLPDVLVKGADWALERIVGRAEVEAAGGVVLRVPLLPGLSTTELLARVRRT